MGDGLKRAFAAARATRTGRVHLIDLLFDKTLCGKDAAVKSRWPNVKWTIARERATCRTCAKSPEPHRVSL